MLNKKIKKMLNGKINVKIMIFEKKSCPNIFKYYNNIT